MEPLARKRVTDSATVATCRDVQALDVTRDLDGRVLHVTADGLEWMTPADTLPGRRLLDAYYYLVLTRAVDREIARLVRKGVALGKHLMCTGNEASAVGATLALRPEEWVALAIRDLGTFMVRGVSPTRVLAQACGRTNGLTGGWDGSLHMGSRPHRIAGLVSHLGTLVSVATGCAFAERYRNADNAVLAFAGEGATSCGDVHEALNIASVLDLPLVVVIENNQWAFGTPSRLQYAVPTLALRALAYGPRVEGLCVDGTDVSAVHYTVAAALDRARRRRGITIVETVSMRLEGHSLADPYGRYVPEAQLELWRARDPIARCRARLITGTSVLESEVLAVEQRVADEVRAATLEAEAGRAPDSTALTAKVFVSTSVAVPGEVVEPVAGEGAHMPYYRAIQDALREELDRDPDLFLIGEDIGVSGGAFKVTEGFSRRYDQIDWPAAWLCTGPVRQRRIIDAPIAEAGFTGLALGAVLSGLRAVVEFQYADFASEAFKMIVNYAATQAVRDMGPVPVVFRMPAGWAPSTSLYHSVNPESWFASTPGLKIVAPVTAYDAKGLLKAAVRDDNPVIYLEYKAHYRTSPDRLPPELNRPVPEADYVVPIGQARVVRTGTDLSLITYGSQVFRALAAANRLAVEDGASIEVIDLRTIIPYDRAALRASVRKTNRAVVTCEAPRSGCFGATLVTNLIADCFPDLDAPVTLVAAADTPVPFAPTLESAHLPTEQSLVAAIRKVLSY